MFRRLIIFFSSIMVGSTTVGADTDIWPQLLSDYVVRPEGKGLTLKVRMNQTGNTFHSKGTVDGVYSKSDLSTSHKTTFSLAATYRGIGAAIAINPAKWSGVYKDYEFNLNY